MPLLLYKSLINILYRYYQEVTTIQSKSYLVFLIKADSTFHNVAPISSRLAQKRFI